MANDPYISDSSWTCTISAASTTVTVAGIIPLLQIKAGDDLIGAAGGKLAIAGVSSTTITLMRPAPAHEAGTNIPLVVARGAWRSLISAASVMSQDVYAQMLAAARDGRFIPALGRQDTPPNTPVEGDRYVVGTSPTGAWEGKANRVAEWSDVAGGWVYVSPSPGWAVMIEGNPVILLYTGTGWEAGAGPPGPPSNITLGPVANLPAGSTPTVTSTGTAPNQTLHFGLVRGADGIGGPADPTFQAVLRQMELEAALARLPTPITDLPSLNLDFLTNTYFARGVAVSADLQAFISAMAGSFSRASAAWYFDGVGTLQQAASNVPRIDHDPATGVPLGYLSEPPRTNSLPQNGNTGAVVGNPGNMPNGGWFTQSTAGGIGREIVSIGTENGIPYIDLRFFGTANTMVVPYIAFSTTNAIPAGSGQTWSGSVFITHIAGQAVSAILRIAGYTSTGATTENISAPSLPVPSGKLSASRFAVAGTLANASTQRATIVINIGSFQAGQTADFTVRVGMPQFELGAFVSSPIMTMGTAVARLADSLLFPMAPWLGAEMTMLSWARIDRVQTASSSVSYELSNIARSTRLTEFVGSGNTTLSLLEISGVNMGQVTVLTGQPAGTVRRIATAASASGRRMSGNGGAIINNANPAVMTFAERLGIGVRTDGAVGLDGHVQRLVCIPKYLAEAQVRALSGATF